MREARAAFEEDEVPVGCVVVHGNRVIGRGHNQRERLNDSTAHAEMIAISAACEQNGSWRLEDTVLYVTMEPCPMCAGAIVLSRIPKIVYAVRDPKAGACGSLYNITRDPRLNHTCDIVTGVLEDQSRELIQAFFKKLREKRL